MASRSKRASQFWYDFPYSIDRYRSIALRAKGTGNSIGFNYLCRWFSYVFEQLYFPQTYQGDLPWLNTGNDADWFGGQLHIADDILLSTAHAAWTALSLDGPRSAPSQV